MKAPYVIALMLITSACASPTSNNNSCVPGASTACACSSGSSGAQVCGDDGKYGQCVCGGSGAGGSAGNSSGTGGSTGAGGSTGSGGVTGSGGTTGSGGRGGSTGAGGATGSGGSVGNSTIGQFTVTYDQIVTKTLSTCYECRAIWTASDGVGGASFNFSVDGSFTGVAVALRPASGGGYEVSLGLTEQNTTLPSALRGQYSIPNVTWGPLATSCVTIPNPNLQHGGGFSGTMNCTFMGGNDTIKHSAVVQGTFTAAFPP